MGGRETGETGREKAISAKDAALFLVFGFFWMML